jgi:hypothetical protein
MESLFVQDCIPRRVTATLFRPVLESRVQETELKYGQQRMDL